MDASLWKAIVVREYGGPEVLRLEDFEVKQPDHGELFIRQTAIGVHYHDIYVRSGLYNSLGLPGIPGIEATGIVEGIGPGCSRFRLGDRVVYITDKYGAYASHRILDEKYAIKLPKSMPDDIVATNFSRALTVQMLARHVTQLNASHTIYVTAAAGGVGRLLCQWANDVGARVIGGVSSEEKLKLASSYGCHESLVYTQDNFIDHVDSITNGHGFDIVFDSVGADTFKVSLEVVAKCGHLVNFGQSSGVIDPLEVQVLAKKSLTISRPILFHYIDSKEKFGNLALEAFNFLQKPSLILPTPEAYSIANASTAHSILESRQGGGSLYLTP